MNKNYGGGPMLWYAGIYRIPEPFARVLPRKL